MNFENNSSISYKVGFNQEVHNEFVFIKPEEAPVFRPSLEEFNKGPLEYIKKIRPIAEKYGICKIIPPTEFKHEFEVEPDKFMFKPRVQRINELEALTRAKLCFFEKIIKYWNLQGASLKIPVIDRKIVDLYKLHRTVFEEGGFENCVREKKWMKIAAKLYPFNTNKSTAGSLLRQHYERILYPYDIFVSGASTGQKIDEYGKTDSNNNKMDIDIKIEIEEVTKTNEEPSSNKRNIEEECEENSCVAKKGKTGRTVARRSSTRLSSMKNSQVTNSSSYSKMMISNDAINHQSPDTKTNINEKSNKIFCKLCNLSKDQDRTRKLLVCDSCEDYYHLNCLIIPLNSLPKGKWNCPKCVADLVPKLPKPYTHEFGFAESRCKYSLNEFGDVAEKFKKSYFNVKSLEDIDLDLVEKEYWRLVTCIDDMVTVEYGADLHTSQIGNGFATAENDINNPYVDHPWNLNKLPLLEGSLFKYINSNINGMIVPWVYVGMCFSTFCWHNEDHWTYSINYLHWGEVKTWYGVPGDAAEIFEKAIAKTAPELFEAQPDLLHQLVTICNPNLLQEKNVPIYRTNQKAGEFVVTFPRSYHAGFNQGFNLAEAVNFAPLDWLSIGRLCMDNYTKLKRYPVFSHDELICNMSIDKNLSAFLLNHVYEDIIGMVQNERNNRKQALDYGITKSKNVLFNQLADDERQCDFCKTTCFLSALTCDCDENKLVCLQHMRELCKTCSSDKYTLNYTYRLDELVTLLKNLEERLGKYLKWSSKMKKLFDSALGLSDSSTKLNKSILNNENKTKINLNELVKLKKVGEELNVPKSSKIFTTLVDKIDDVKNIKKKLNKILNFNSIEDERITFEEFTKILSDLNNFNVNFERQETIKSLYEESSKLINEIEKTLTQSKKPDNKTINKLNNLNDKFSFLNLDELFKELSIKCPAINGSDYKVKSKQKKLNRLNNQLISPIKNIC